MPRPRKDSPDRPNSIVASAARVRGRSSTGRTPGAIQEWQTQSWHYYDTCGELEFVIRWKANALSRVTLSLQQYQDDGTLKPVSAGDPAAVLASLFQGETGQSQMMGALAIHLGVPGECWLVGTPPKPNEPDRDRWRVLSTQEVKMSASTWEIDTGDGEIERWPVEVTDDTPPEKRALFIRLWDPHPARSALATSPVRAALPILAELEGLTKHVGASIDSRLSGAGILFLPQEMSFKSPAPDDDGTDDPEDDPFFRSLTESILASIKDQGSAAAKVPVVVQTPGAFIANVKHITFDTPLDQQAIALREEAIRRLAMSLDIPAEVLLGTADVNHWGSWQIEEAAIKVHVEPVVNLITHALTTKFLWPALSGDVDAVTPEAMRYVIVGDTSSLRMRPEKTDVAKDLHDALLISDEARLRESGFGVEDMPLPDEKARRRRERVADGAVTPDMVLGALQSIGVTITPAAALAPGSPAPMDPTGVQAPPADTPPPAVEAPRDIPQMAAALMASASLLVDRAVERGRNKAVHAHRVRKGDPIPAEHMGSVLADAWTMVPATAEMLGVDADSLTAALTAYAEAVLTQGAPAHNPRVLARCLSERVTGAALALGARDA